ncbi:MaoC/PaaZ C-terminal domain-containing protein [Nocardioides sp. AN3]
MRANPGPRTRLEDDTIYVLPDGPARREVTHEVSDRWLLAFAAGVSDTRQAYVDVELPDGIIAHPTFSACLEWPLVATGAPGIALTPTTLHRGLHVEQTSTLHTPIRPGHVLTTVAELDVAEQRTRAVHIATKFTTTDDSDEVVAVTRTHMLYPGVRLWGEQLSARRASRPTRTAGDLAPIGTFHVDETNAPIYTECSRIWNPIHTDRRVAKAAGLPGTVLHGTEVLARAISTITAQLPGSPTRISSVSCQFTAPVFPHTCLTVRAARPDDRILHFDVVNDGGHHAISAGTLELPAPEE